MQKLLKPALGSLLFALGGCAATLQKTEPGSGPGELKTIGYVTGTLGDDGTYSAQFKSGAEKVCGSPDYKVTYRGRQPPTLEGVLLPDSMFYWVVKCP